MFYQPRTGGLPTLQRMQGQAFRRLPAPYGYPDDGGDNDFRGGNQTLPQQPPRVLPPAARPNPQPVSPQGAQPPAQSPAPMPAPAEGMSTGGIYQPKPNWWETASWRYRPIDFSGVKDGYIDYGGLAWQRAAAYRPPSDYEDLWKALPNSWKVDLAGRDPQFVEAYLAAVATGNNGQAQDIYKQSGDYREAQMRGEQANAPRAPQVEYRDAPYYMPGR